MTKAKLKVVIEVLGGVARVKECPPQVKVVIEDKDVFTGEE